MFIETIWDPSGSDDEFDASVQSQRVIIDLRQGEFSSIGALPNGSAAIDNVAIAFGSVIEHAKGGAGNDAIIGNVENNMIEGGEGNDWLMGDGIVLGQARADATNGLQGALSGVAPKTSEVGYLEPEYEPPTDNDSGNDTLSGGDGNDWLWGGMGDDELDGGDGLNELWGGIGDDTFIIGDASGWYEAEPDTIMDAELDDRAVFGEIELGDGEAGAYYLYIDEFENEHWLLIEDEEGYTYFDDTGLIEYYIWDGDLHIALYDDEADVDSVIVEGWSDGELGIHLSLYDNRPGAGGNSPQLLDDGGDLIAADVGNAKAGARAMLNHADILEGLTSGDEGGNLRFAIGDRPATETAAVVVVARAPENIVSASADEVALMAA